MKNPKSICVLRLSALGDVCNILPSISQLSENFSDAKIVWILGKEVATILESVNLCKNVEIVIYDKSTGLRGMRQIWQKLGKTKFDVFCIMQTALRANILSLGIKAKIKLGYDWARSKDGHYFFANRHIKKSPDKKIIEAYFDFLRYLGIKNPKWQWRLQLEKLDAKEFDFIEHKYFLLNPCSSSPKRDLSPQVYAEVMFQIWQKYKIIGVITGVNSDYVRNFASSILQKLAKLQKASIDFEKVNGAYVDSEENSLNFKKVNGAYRDLVGKTTIAQLWALVEKAEFVISPDSAILHLAAATQTPPIGLYANKNPDYTGSIFGDAYFVSKYSQAAEKYLGKSVQTGIYKNDFLSKNKGFFNKKLKFGTSIKSAQAMQLIKAQDILNKVELAILMQDLKQI